MVLVVAFVVAVVLTPIRWWPLYLVEALLVGLAYASSQRPWRLLVTRVAAMLPFLLLIAGSIVVARAMQGGWDLAAQILIRGLLALAAMAALIITTPFPEILTALARLRLPATLVSILTFMYRYLFVLTDQLSRMRRAKLARTVRSSWRAELALAAELSGILFVRTFERAERVYAAMYARGWTGCFHPADHDE